MVVAVAPSVARCLLSPRDNQRGTVGERTQMLAVQRPSVLYNSNRMEEPLYATVRKHRRSSPDGQSLSPTSPPQQQNSLEAHYGGKELANYAATVIQRAYRAARLQRQFSKLLSLALSTDRLDKRLSLLGPSLDPVEVNVDTGLPVHAHLNANHKQSPNNNANKQSSVPDNIDLLILQAAGLETFSSYVQNKGPSARLIQNRKTSHHHDYLRRSTSLRINRKSAMLRKEISRARDDLDLPPSPPSSPVPPCPPLMGSYCGSATSEDAIYVTRDSLYAREGNYEVVPPYSMDRRSPPRPPQRTVSFLANDTLPQKVNKTKQDQPLPPPPPHAVPYSSDSSLLHLQTYSPVRQQSHQRTVSYLASPSQQQPLHARSYSSPAPLSPLLQVQPPLPAPCVIDIPEETEPLPPPPYISPPSHRETDSPPLPPPPATPPLPPPPPPMEHIQGNSRPPCDSSSSASSIDSGFRSSCGDHVLMEVPNSPSMWVPSPNLIVSPEGMSPIRDTVFEPRPRGQINYQRPHQLMLQQRPQRNTVVVSPVQQDSMDTTYSDVYGSLKSSSSMGTPVNYSPVKVKKTVRILTPDSEQVNDVTRRRQYRVGLNLFNQNPDRGMEYLLKKNFLDFSPAAVGKFLRGRKGLSKKMIGQYLCQLQRPFNLAALHCFTHEMDFCGLHLDIALRQLYQEITFPGEAQKIEKMVEIFAKRYIACNQMFVAGFRSADTLFVLSYAIVLLNTDLHSKAVRPSRRMKRDDFVRNLRGVDSGADLDGDMLRGIYDRIKASELKAGADHVSQVARVDESMVGKRPWTVLAETSRRLVCFCRLTEVPDLNKKSKKDGAHQRGVFLFNDILVVSKTMSKKGSTQHQIRYSLPLKDVRINVFSTAQYPFGIQLQDKLTGKVSATFNARSESDQQRFVNDLQESSAEMAEMERAKNMLNEAEVTETLC